MTKNYQLVAWTDKGRVKMIPSEISAFMHKALDGIDRLCGRIRYDTWYEIGDILRVSRAYERLAVRLLDLGKTEEAFLLSARAAECCCDGDNWEDCEDYEDLCRPLRGRFFAMYSECKALARRYPELEYSWEKTGLRKCFRYVTAKDMWINRDYIVRCGDPDEARNYTKALNFGKNEVCHHRKA